MTILKNTISLCPVCYRQIPGQVVTDGYSVFMKKTCPIHDETISMIECSLDFYLFTMEHNSDIYEGHLIDVTERCDLKCKYCYYAKGTKDIDAKLIINEARVNTGPYILTGGEPTLRDDLPQILRDVKQIGETHFLTNGSGFVDRKYLKECAESASVFNGYNCIGFSYHPEQIYFSEIVENMKAENIKPKVLFWVIDNLDQIPDVVKFAEKHKGMFGDVRIKVASNVWSQSETSKLFVSQVVGFFKAMKGDLKLYNKGKSSFYPIMFNGITYLIISWMDATNIDCLDIHCPPTYRAKNGEVTDFVTAMLINEGISKGWLNGEPFNRRAYPSNE